MLGTSTEVAEDDYTIQYMVDGDWGTGFYGSISVTNNTDTDLEDWVLEFDFYLYQNSLQGNPAHHHYQYPILNQLIDYYQLCCMNTKQN